MAKINYDLIVIGGGSGGVACARRSASYGAKTLLFEGSRLGGTCVIRGCVPKKLFTYVAGFNKQLAHAKQYGWQLADDSNFVPQLDWSHFMAKKNAEIDRLEAIYSGMLNKAGVDVVAKFASLNARNNVVVDADGNEYQAQKILIAVGGTPNHLAQDSSSQYAITSDEVLELPTLPKSMIIVGSGYIAIEFASIFNALGVEVHLLIRGDRVFRAADKELGMQLTHDLAASGIIIHTKTTIKEVGANWVKINEDVVLTAEKIVNATGRVANVSRLNLHQAGIDQQDDGSIIVDDGFLTSRGDVYAVGDVINRYNLTPVAIAQGRALAEHWFNNKPFIYDENFISTAVFSTPEVATVGLSEEQAKGQYGDDNVAIYRSHFKPMKYTLTDDNNAKVMYKIVVEKSSGKLLGVHLLGENSAELIQTISTLLRMGATKEDIDMTMAVHPTSAEELVTSYIPVS